MNVNTSDFWCSELHPSTLHPTCAILPQMNIQLHKTKCIKKDKSIYGKLLARIIQLHICPIAQAFVQDTGI